MYMPYIYTYMYMWVCECSMCACAHQYVHLRIHKNVSRRVDTLVLEFGCRCRTCSRVRAFVFGTRRVPYARWFGSKLGMVMHVQAGMSVYSFSCVRPLMPTGLHVCPTLVSPACLPPRCKRRRSQAHRLRQFQRRLSRS